ncbi:MAG: hypothetical protein JWP48_6841 [Actinoallomurus sp.]|jgi:uncharacterized membrane protein|nr:hypothetical protein [Actinoallomurus sp.]
MFSTIFGLPAHPLVVHAVVVLVPLAALSALVVALWPAARSRYAPLALGIATLALISIPLATQTGDQLEKRVQPSAFVERHTAMADGLLPFMAVLWLGLLTLVVARRLSASRGVSWTRYLAGGAAVVAVVGAVASGVQVARIGDSGARAAWHGVATSSGDVAGPHH